MMKKILIVMVLLSAAVFADTVHAAQADNYFSRMIDEADHNISQEKTKGFDTSGAESVLLEAKQALEEGKYSKTYGLVKKADVLVHDTDMDGISNSMDFAPSINNVRIFFIYIVILLAVLVMVLVSCRNREHIEKMKQEVYDIIDQIVPAADEKDIQSKLFEQKSMLLFQVILLSIMLLGGYIVISPNFDVASGISPNLTATSGISFRLLYPAALLRLGQVKITFLNVGIYFT